MDFEQPAESQQVAEEGSAGAEAEHTAAETLQEMSLQDAEAAVGSALTVTPLGGASTSS